MRKIQMTIKQQKLLNLQATRKKKQHIDIIFFTNWLKVIVMTQYWQKVSKYFERQFDIINILCKSFCSSNLTFSNLFYSKLRHTCEITCTRCLR